MYSAKTSQWRENNASSKVPLALAGGTLIHLTHFVLRFGVTLELDPCITSADPAVTCAVVVVGWRGGISCALPEIEKKWG